MAAARAMANGAAFVAPVVQGAPEVAVAVEEAQAPQAAEAAPMAMEGAEAAPPLNDAQIALLRASHAYGGIYDALATHIVESMGNLPGSYYARDEATAEPSAAE